MTACEFLSPKEFSVSGDLRLPFSKCYGFFLSSHQANTLRGATMTKKLFLCGFAIFLLSCSDDDEISSSLTSYDHDVIQYFTEVALGFEFGASDQITRKWKDGMRIFVGGNKTPALMNELTSIIAELNSLATDGFAMSLVSDSLDMNYYIFLGSAADYGKIFPSQAGLAIDNWGLFSVSWNSSNEIENGTMYVDISRANDVEERHLLREELTQSLGLAKDSGRYNDSIFQSQWTLTTAYSNIDKDLIRLLYHPRMTVGLSKGESETVLTDIILSEK
jgi:hypothetical protein